jgi:hypothetical protein
LSVDEETTMAHSTFLPGRRGALSAALALAGASVLPRLARADASREIHFMTHPVRTGHLGDFDFLVGSWNVANRRLRRSWSGASDWETFPATSRCSKHLRGIVNVDQMVMPTLGDSGLTVRAFDFEQRRWTICCIDSRTGMVFPPAHGGFDGDRGEFYGEDLANDRKVRLIWTKRGADAAHCEQAFSRDGRNWETRWVMDLTRTAPSAQSTAHSTDQASL